MRRRHLTVISQTGLLVAVLATTVAVAGTQPVALSNVETTLVGLWQRPGQDGLTEYLVLRSDRTGLAWTEVAMGRESERVFVHWEVRGAEAPGEVDMLLVEQVSEGELFLLDATWAPHEAICVVDGMLFRGRGSAPAMTRVPSVSKDSVAL